MTLMDEGGAADVLASYLAADGNPTPLQPGGAPDAQVFTSMARPPRIEVLAQPIGGADMGTAVTVGLGNGAWKNFRAVVAFLKLSGLRHLASPLDVFLTAGGEAKLSIGIDHDRTSLEGRLVHQP